MAKTLKKIQSDKKSKCMNTKCKLWLKESRKNLKIFKNALVKDHTDFEKKQEKECKKSGSKKEECKKMQNKIKISEKLIDNLENSIKSGKNDKLELSICEKRFCNEGCKNNILEDGPPDKLPKYVEKLYKNNKELIKMMTKRRKDIFKNKTSVLKDNFYEGLKPKTLKKLKKEGAISGCFINA